GSMQDDDDNNSLLRAFRHATRVIATRMRIRPLVHLGIAYLRLGDVPAANRALRRALALSESVGDRSPDFLQVLTFLGQTESALGHHDEALAFYDRGWSLASRMYRRGSPERVTLLIGRADAESRRGRAGIATALYEQAQA